MKEILGQFGRQNMLRLYLKNWDWDWILAVQWRLFPLWASVVRAYRLSQGVFNSIQNMDWWKKFQQKVHGKVPVIKIKSLNLFVSEGWLEQNKHIGFFIEYEIWIWHWPFVFSEGKVFFKCQSHILASLMYGEPSNQRTDFQKIECLRFF